MHRNRYLLGICCTIIILIIIVRSNNIKNRDKAQVNEPIAVAEAQKDIDPNILIKDDNKIVVKPKVIAPKPYISAESYLIGNLETGELYINFNTDKVFPIASVSKLYTALVVHHLFDQDKEIEITQKMLDAYGDAGHLVLGEKFTSSELLYPLLLESSNDVAEAYAQSFGYDDFMNKMNGFAQEIGMNKTSFKDPSGLDASNISNSKDLFILAKYLYNNEPDILKISDTKEFDFATTTEHGSHIFININPYSNYPEFIGGKTGRTDFAKESMVSLFKQVINGKTYPIAIIILRSEFGEREIDTEKLLGMFIDKVNKK